MGKLFMMWVLSLALVAGLVAAATAQVTPQTQPRVLSGNDIGFRIDGTDQRSGRPIGRIVVRLNGEWVEPATPMRARPATAK